LQNGMKYTAVKTLDAYAHSRSLSGTTNFSIK